MITLYQNDSNNLYFTLETRKTDSEFYMIDFTNEMTQETVRIFPVLVSENPRNVVLQVILDFFNEIPLSGSINLNPSGTYSYDLYVASNLSLTPTSSTLVQEGYAVVIESCEENPSYTFLSSNEDALSEVFLSNACDNYSVEVNYYFTLETRKADSEFYMMEIQSQMAQKTYRFYPTLVTENSRYVQLQAIYSDTGVSPLTGVINPSPAGTYAYRVYSTSNQSLTPTSFTLLEEGQVQIETCTEVTTYSFTSDNENASAKVFLNVDCAGLCISWNNSGYWNLVDELWNCQE